MHALYKHKKYPDSMLAQKTIDAIKLIHKRLEDNQIRWALVGSTNLKLQGIEVEPQDLDIVIQHKDLENVSKIFEEYSASAVKKIETLSGDDIWEVNAEINGIEIQFFGGDEKEIYVSKLLASKISMAKLQNIEIPCFTLETESQAYKETNREHKAKLIQQFLNMDMSD